MVTSRGSQEHSPLAPGLFQPYGSVSSLQKATIVPWNFCHASPWPDSVFESLKEKVPHNCSARIQLPSTVVVETYPAPLARGGGNLGPRPDAALAYHPVAQVKRRTGGKWPPSRPFENSLHRGHCRGVWRGICEPPESGCRSRENTVCWGRVCGSYQCLRHMIQKGVENYEMIKNRACTVWFDVYGKPPKSG